MFSSSFQGTCLIGYKKAYMDKTAVRSEEEMEQSKGSASQLAFVYVGTVVGAGFATGRGNC